jgi:hypothetical protein
MNIKDFLLYIVNRLDGSLVVVGCCADKTLLGPLMSWDINTLPWFCVFVSVFAVEN